LKQAINRYFNYLTTLTKHSSNLVATDENSQSTSNSLITDNNTSTWLLRTARSILVSIYTC